MSEVSRRSARGPARSGKDEVRKGPRPRPQAPPAAAPSSPSAPTSAPTFERVTTANGVVTLDPNVGVSFVSSQIAASTFLSINLPDGTVDAFQKFVVFVASKEIKVDFYRLFATFDEVPVPGSLNFPSGGGGAVLVWNAEEGFWQVAGVYLSST